MFFLKNILLIFFVRCIFCENILYLVALPSPSHHIWNREIINSLATYGHNLTVLSPDFDSVPIENVHYLKLSEIYEHKHLFELRMSVFHINESSNFLSSTLDMNVMLELCTG